MRQVKQSSVVEVKLLVEEESSPVLEGILRFSSSGLEGEIIFNGLWLGKEGEYDVRLYGTLLGDGSSRGLGLEYRREVYADETCRISRGDFYLSVIKSSEEVREVFRKSLAARVVEDLIEVLKRNVEKVRWMSFIHTLYEVKVFDGGYVLELIDKPALECEIRTESGEVLYTKEKQNLRRLLETLKELQELKDQNQKIDRVKEVLGWIYEHAF